MSASVTVEAPELRIDEVPGSVLGAPIRKANGWPPPREYFVVPETGARMDVPAMGIYKAPTWKPLAEDIVVRAGYPAEHEGLLAVCVFMTISDEQLVELARSLTP